MIKQFIKLTAICTLGIILAFGLGYVGIRHFVPQEAQAIGAGGVSTPVPFRRSGLTDWIPTNTNYQFGATTTPWAAIFTTNLNVAGVFTLGGNVEDNDMIPFGDSDDYAIGYSSVEDSLQFVDGATIDTNVRLTIDSSGYVGIATTSPRAKLDVWGNAMFGTTSDTSVPTLYVDSGNGRVGIGTTTQDTTYILTTPSNNEIFATGGIIFNHSSSQAIYGSGQDSIDGFFQITGGTSGGDGLIIMDTGEMGLGHDFYFDGSLNGMELMLDTVGNVGIGTTTPRVILDTWGSARFGTSTDSVLHINAGTGDITVGGSLLTGNIIFPDDGGAMSAFNMSVSATPATSTEQSYSLEIDDNGILKVYAEAMGENGGGGIQDIGVLITGKNATTTDPDGLFHATEKSGATTTQTIGSDQASPACLKLRDVDNGAWTYCRVLNGTMTCGTDPCD